MPPKLRAPENVWTYPRPARAERTAARLRVVWTDAAGAQTTLADTTDGWRVLETSHPPTYYFPPSAVRLDLLKPSAARRTLCEWKGQALYHDVFSARARIWSYPAPTPAFAPIKDYLCFYASSNTKGEGWTCFVDDDQVVPQEGDFYGSWITPEITGGERGFKGGAGTWGW